MIDNSFLRENLSVLYSWKIKEMFWMKNSFGLGDNFFSFEDEQSVLVLGLGNRDRETF